MEFFIPRATRKIAAPYFQQKLSETHLPPDVIHSRFKKICVLVSSLQSALSLFRMLRVSALLIFIFQTLLHQSRSDVRCTQRELQQFTEEYELCHNRVLDKLQKSTDHVEDSK